MTTETLIGQEVKRVEDQALITGRGQYIDDLRLPGLLHLALVRSPYGHAKINRVDVSAAANAPGVVSVFTGADLAEQLGSLPAGWVLDEESTGMKTPEHPPLAIEKVRYVGDAVAAVVADSPAAASDAVALVDVDYEPLEAAVDAEAATKDGAPQVHDDAPGNLAFDWAVGAGDYDAAAAEADVVVKERIVNQRLIPNPMEPRGIMADYNAGTEQLTIWTSTQIPHLVRLLFALVTGHPEHKVRVVAPDVGGGFGCKLYLYAEEVILGIVAKQLERPVKWIESRTENYVATTHGRDHIADAEICGTKDGVVTGLKVHVYANLGGYLSTFAPAIPTILFGLMLGGCYKVENLSCQVKGVFTNTTPVDAYRGAGRPEATYVVERMMERYAHEIGRDVLGVRRRNLVRPFKRGQDMPIGVTYDSGNYQGALNAALDIFDYQAFRQEQREARSKGKFLGVGFSTYIEICGMAPSAVAGALGAGAGLWESSTVRVHPTGTVTVFTGTSPHGQGHETTLAQITSSRLGIPMENVEVVHGDTERHQFGTGTFGSRSLAVGGQALMMSLDKVIEKAKKIAAHEMGVDARQVRFENGTFYVEDIQEREIPWGDVALGAYWAKNLPEGLEPGLEAVSFFDPDNFTWPFGTHIAVVEIDEVTGETRLVRYVAIDDVGNVINPMIVDGMVHGGIAQGVGQALQESAVYSDDGQLLTGSMMDYAVPTAEDFPSFETDRTVTPTPVNALGAKGAGETGTIAASPAVVNAAVDALKHLGVTHLNMPLSAEKMWRAINDAKEERRLRRSAAARRGN
jgi:carbon-monoxide dehydrogenase large subunit